MKYDQAFFDQDLNRRGTACEKWDGLEARLGREMNPMWVADMDFPCPEEVTRALVRRAAHPAYGYTEVTAQSTRAMLDFMRRRHGLDLSPQEQIMLPCVISGLRAAVLALTELGDAVIVQPPVYGPFYRSVEENGRRVAACPLRRLEGGRYEMDLTSVEAACKAGARLMMLCSPHNPVGRCWTEEELRALMALLARYEVALVSDEIHEDFVFAPAAFVPALRLAAGQTVLSLTSASKTFNLAGLQQAALMCRDQKLLERLRANLNAAGVVQGNIFGMTASEAAYRDGDAWLDGLLAYVRQSAELLRQELCLRLPMAVMSPLEATYLAWVDLRAYGLNCEALLERCRAQGVEFTPGTFFGKADGEGFLRVNLACPHRRVRLAAQQLERAIKAS